MKTMLIAKLTVGVKYDGVIRRNQPTDLNTVIGRGSVLTDGAVVRGDGTSFVSKEAKQRYDTLKREEGVIREGFNRRFMRAPFPGYFCIDKAGDAKAFADTFTHDPNVELVVTEFAIAALGGGFDEEDIASWNGRVYQQLQRVPLGKGNPKNISLDGIRALELLAKCPMLSKETSGKILALAEQARANQIDRLDLARGIELLEVKIDQFPILEIDRTIDLPERDPLV